MQTTEKKLLNLHEPEDALAWIDAFKARCRAEKKTDVDANGSNPADYQITDQFIFRCGVESLKKVKSLVAPTKLETMPFKDIATVLENYLQPRKRLVIAEQTKFVAITQKNGESSGDFLARLREAARFCEFANLKTVADPEAYMIRLRFIAGIQNSEHKMKVLEHLQQKPDATIDDILLVIQQREQTVQFVNKPTEPNETISFVRNGIQRNKSTGNGKKVPDRQNYARDCSKCGTKHEPRSCPAFGKICNSCKKPNHYAKMCRRKTYPTNFVAGDTNDKRNSESASECSYFIGYSDYIKNGTMENIQLFGREVPMLRDTGASLTLISTKIWDQLGRPELKEMTTGVETYDNHKMKYLGALFANVIYGNKPLKIKIAVVESDRSFGLLGRDILNRCIDKVDRCFNAVNEKTLPTVKGAIASIKLKSNAKPMFCPARKVPLPLEKKVNQTIDELLSLGILEPVEAGGVENCSPVVWVKKGDKLRMCADYKVHVNDKINTEAYPLPCIETIFSKVSGAKYFAKIDLSNAYWQIPLDKKSQEVCTVNTTRGLFRVTRLQQGLKNAAAIFQQSIEKVLKGLPGCVAYQDDILLYGVTEAELKKRYNAVKERLAGKNFTVNEEKCVSFSTTLSFLGYEISSDGVKPDPKHIEKLLQLQPPKDVKEVEAFIGLINYFGRMIPNYAAKTQCINELRQKDKQFKWTDECQKAFQSLVDELTNKPLVQPYSLDNEVTLTTDASEKTIGGVLTQNGHPVIYISRNLSKSEQKYSNIEREGLAVVFAVTRLKQYLLGRKFTLRTDHKPLQYIFNPNSQIPKVVSARLARWAITLMAYDYEVQYTPGQEIGHADAMSRLRFKDDENDLVAVAMATFEKPVIDINVLQKNSGQMNSRKELWEEFKKAIGETVRKWKTLLQKYPML